MRDYTGKVVYVGTDVHKKIYSCVTTCILYAIFSATVRICTPFYDIFKEKVVLR